MWYKIKAHDKQEKFHLSYIKSTLGVRFQTATDTLMSDTGRFPLQLRKHLNVIKYWLRLAKLGNGDLVCNAFDTLVKLHNFRANKLGILTTAPVDQKKLNYSQYKR